MSGGSYNYASSIYDLRSMIAKLTDLSELAEDLQIAAPNSKASADTVVLIILADWLDKKITDEVSLLNHVWKALEWWKSCDWSEEQFREAVADYERKSNNG